MHAIDQRPAPPSLALAAWRAHLRSVRAGLGDHSLLLTVLAASGVLAGLMVAASLAGDPREAGGYAVACLMIGGGIVLGRRGGARSASGEATSAPVAHEVRDEIRAVAHDLRAPLLTVSSYLELIAQGDFGPVSPEAQAALRQCVSVTARAQHVVETTLRPRPSEGAEDGRAAATVDLGVVFSDVLDALTGTMRAEGAEVALAGRLPRVRGDETALFRVFENLLQNAMKYGAPGCPPRIGITWRRVDGDIEVSVRDNGRGIAREHFHAITEQGVRGTDATPGTGLGLATAARLVSRMGGTLMIDSQTSRSSAGAPSGTVVRVTLPSG
ncbi:MAG: HAMP domain-containing histidine kinase [Dehalococcoidia bacterium]|nr:HAMP domain-containing histidine kinase [Dehalococcoidia bacterium]